MKIWKDTLKNFTPALKAIAKNTKSTYESIKSHINEKKDTYKENNFLNEFKEVIPRVYHMPFPTELKIITISDYLNTKYQANYYIWNISEHSYNIELFNNQVAENIFIGYPCPNLNQMFFIAKSILSWLNNDPKNIAIVHCQESKGRSALIMSCLLCLMKIFHHPAEALTYFCMKTKTYENSILFPSHNLYLRYFANILDGFKPNNKTVRIIKIMFSDIIFPKIKKNDELGILEDENLDSDDDNKIVRPYLQIFKDSNIIYNSLNIMDVKSYRKTDISFWFDININTSEDILIRCKHFYSNEIRFPIFRIMMNTGFVFDNVIRFYKRDIDFSSHSIVNDNFFIDIFFDLSEIKENMDSNNLSSFDYIMNECDKNIEPKLSKKISNEKQIPSKPKFEQIIEAKPKSPPKIQLKEKEKEIEKITEQTSDIYSKIMKKIDEDHELNENDIDQYLN